MVKWNACSDNAVWLNEMLACQILDRLPTTLAFIVHSEMDNQSHCSYSPEANAMACTKYSQKEDRVSI